MKLTKDQIKDIQEQQSQKNQTKESLRLNWKKYYTRLTCFRPWFYKSS